MKSLEKDFKLAVVTVQKSEELPGERINVSNNDKLEFYGLYKQATVGPNDTEAPMVLNVVARSKWNAWTAVKELSREDAMRRYVEKLSAISPSWREAAEHLPPELRPTAGGPKRAGALAGKVAIVTGSSRGIGRSVALALAREGCAVTVAAKSVTEQKNLPGTIFTVAKEIEALGSRALPLQCDVRDVQQIENMVAKTVETFGRVDIMISNAGALWWKTVANTPVKRYDLINQINARATFFCARACLPYMRKQGGGHIIVMSPPIDLSMLKGKVGYCISKFGMTMVAHGLAEEERANQISVNALWPATMIESFATINFKLGDRKMWRTAEILADSCVEICKLPPSKVTGQALIDEDFLREYAGVTDFAKYQCVPGHEPPRMTPQYPQVGRTGEGSAILKPPQPQVKSGANAASGNADRAEAFLNDIESALARGAGKAAAKVASGTFCFQVQRSGGGSFSFALELRDGDGKLHKQNLPKADVTFSMAEKEFFQMLAGKLDATNAFMEGKLAVEGDMGLAMKFEKVMQQLPKARL